MECIRITYKLHAIEQMFARTITQKAVEMVVRLGETITTYPTDKPYPSILRLGFVDDRPIHIVVAQDELGECYVVTAYEPNVFLWNPDFKTKKK